MNKHTAGTGQVAQDTASAGRIAELERKVAELEKLDRARDEFLAILSHELRNPIQAILTNAWLIKGRIKDAELKRPTDAIERQVGKLSKILDDLLDVIRVAQPAAISPQAVGVQQVVGAAVEQVKSSADAHRRELVVRMPSQPLYVRADASRLVQAVRNIVANAVKFSPQQGEIVVRVASEGGQAVISVRDQGVGIASDDLPNVFTLFRAGASSRNRSTGGLGIGLHVARELVESHGGTIEARSDGPNLGSEFLVRLPLTTERPPAEPTAPEAGGEAAATGALCILVVDDSRDSADSLAELLRTYGHKARVAYHGAAAVDLAREGGFDLALVDITMPAIDGYEVARQISATPEARGTMLVAVTGWGAKSDRERSRQAGFSFHLTKPIDQSVLESLLATAARKRPA